jgi:hypothetical protein
LEKKEGDPKYQSRYPQLVVTKGLGGPIGDPRIELKIIGTKEDRTNPKTKEHELQTEW